MLKYLVCFAAVLILSCSKNDDDTILLDDVNDTISTLTFVNTTFTPLTLALEGKEYVIVEGGSLEFITKPNNNYSYSALTRGLYLDYVNFPTTNVIGAKAGADNRVEFTIPEDYFYMIVNNGSSTPVVRVDIYFDNQVSGLGGKPVIANNGSFYGVGYLSVHANSITFKSVDCRTCSDVQGTFWYFGDGSNNGLGLTPQPIPPLSGTENQSVVFELN